MSLTAFLGAIELGLILSLVALAVYLTFRLLDFPDLTVEGSFPLGAAVVGVLMVDHHVNPYLACVAAAVAGAAAGALTGWLAVRLKIIPILAGILVMTALYSINLRVMGRPNVSLLGAQTIYTPLEGWLGLGVRSATIALLVVVIAATTLLLNLFLLSRIGLALRAAGANPRMATANGVGNGAMIILGLSASNAIAALAGAALAQSLGAADVTMGFGIIVVGLAALIVGEGLMSARTVVLATLGCIVGSLLYRLAVSLALNVNFLGIQAQDLNLVTAVLVAVFVVAARARDRARARPIGASQTSDPAGAGLR